MHFQNPIKNWLYLYLFFPNSKKIDFFFPFAMKSNSTTTKKYNK